MSNQTYNSWISYPSQKVQAELRLFCFPYAGGNAAIFRGWANNLPDTVEVCPVQLPGRGHRLAERPFTRLTPLVQVLTEALYPFLDKPFAFFGHSMGGLISFELARHLRRNCGLSPTHLFISGRQASHLPYSDARLYLLPETELIQKLRGLNGTPTALLNNPEMMLFMLPTLRADFEICGTYQYVDDFLLECPISAFGGVEDILVNQSELAEWRHQTSSSFRLRMFPGDHFFWNHNPTPLLQAISQDFTQNLCRTLA